MAKVSRNTLKNYFRTGAYPTEQQFGNFIDSMRHMDDMIPMGSVEGLIDALNGKADDAGVDLKDYMVVGQSILPLGSYYTYNGKPVHGRTFDMLDSDFDPEATEGDTTEVVAFCCYHRDDAHSGQGAMYLVYQTGNSGYKCCARYDANSAPEDLLRAFGEAEATTSASGQMSASDKAKLNKLGDVTRITWAQLKALRDSGGLVPGNSYRITDYMCTTAVEGTRSAGHQFDIIVTADSARSLNENAHAIPHDGDTYFQECNLAAWEIKYSLDNDANRFEWACDTIPYIVVDSVKYYYHGIAYNIIDDYPYHFEWYNEEEGTVYSNRKEVEDGDNIVIDPITEESIGTAITGTEQVGRGVIFYMKDENYNECYYDFKNLLFIPYSSDGSETAYRYTFSSLDGGVMTDSSSHKTLRTQENTYEWYTRHNTILSWRREGKFRLQFITHTVTRGTRVYNNRYGIGSNNLTFKGRTEDNVLTVSCHNIEAMGVFVGNRFIFECYNFYCGNQTNYNCFVGVSNFTGGTSVNVNLIRFTDGLTVANHFQLCTCVLCNNSNIQKSYVFRSTFYGEYVDVSSTGTTSGSTPIRYLTIFKSGTENNRRTVNIPSEDLASDYQIVY